MCTCEPQGILFLMFSDFRLPVLLLSPHAYLVELTDDLPFNLANYLVPFAITIGICFIVMLSFMVSLVAPDAYTSLGWLVCVASLFSPFITIFLRRQKFPVIRMYILFVYLLLLLLKFALMFFSTFMRLVYWYLHRYFHLCFIAFCFRDYIIFPFEWLPVIG